QMHVLHAKKLPVAFLEALALAVFRIAKQPLALDHPRDRGDFFPSHFKHHPLRTCLMYSATRSTPSIQIPFCMSPQYRQISASVSRRTVCTPPSPTSCPTKTSQARC